MRNTKTHIAKMMKSNAKGAANCSNVSGAAEDDLPVLAAKALAAFSNSSAK